MLKHKVVGSKLEYLLLFYFARTLVYLSYYVPDITWLSSFCVWGHVENFCISKTVFSVGGHTEFFEPLNATLNAKLNDMLHEHDNVECLSIRGAYLNDVLMFNNCETIEQ